MQFTLLLATPEEGTSALPSCLLFLKDSLKQGFQKLSGSKTLCMGVVSQGGDVMKLYFWAEKAQPLTPLLKNCWLMGQAWNSDQIFSMLQFLMVSGTAYRVEGKERSVLNEDSSLMLGPRSESVLAVIYSCIKQCPASHWLCLWHKLW